jgi:hypothetical protein
MSRLRLSVIEFGKGAVNGLFAKRSSTTANHAGSAQ